MAQPTPASGIDAPTASRTTQLLAMGFGELVAIMAGNPVAAMIGERHHRQLHHARFRSQPVKQLEFQRVDEVLGVVEHDCPSLPPACRLVPQQEGV
jgi:hypothetical protein